MSDAIDTTSPASPRLKPVVNLLPPRRREARHRRFRARVWFGICVSCAVVLAGIYTSWSTIWPDDNGNLANDIARVSRDVEENDRTTAVAVRLMQDEKLTVEVDRDILAQPDWSLLLALLGRTRGEQIVLKHVSLDSVVEALAAPGKGTAAGPVKARTGQPGSELKRLVVNIEGLGRSTTAVSEFLLKMDDLGLFDSVTLQKSTRETFLSGEAVAFRIECILKADGGIK